MGIISKWDSFCGRDVDRTRVRWALRAPPDTVNQKHANPRYAPDITVSSLEDKVQHYTSPEGKCFSIPLRLTAHRIGNMSLYNIETEHFAHSDFEGNFPWFGAFSSFYLSMTSTQTATEAFTLTETKSEAIIRNFLRVYLSLICKERKVFDYNEDNFETKEFVGKEVSVLKPNAEGTEEIINWLQEGAFDALSRKYVCSSNTLYLQCISSDRSASAYLTKRISS